MPIYEFQCALCGPFGELKPMSEYDQPCPCPDCGTLAPRVLLTAPYLSGMSSRQMNTFAINERSSHEPELSSQTGKKHWAGCTCCSGKRASRLRVGRDGSKSFPSNRPWMISH